jgi:hypothetical protein
MPLDAYYNIEDDSLNETFTISSFVPSEFADCETNMNIYKPVFSDHLIKRHNKKIRKYRTSFRKFVLEYLPENGIIKDLTNIVIEFCYDYKISFQNLSKKHIKIENIRQDDEESDDEEEGSDNEESD